MAPRLKKAGITSAGWSYGVGGYSCGTNSPNWNYNINSLTWYSGSLIGVSQSGNAVTIASFTYNGSDYSSPQGQITYRLVP